MATPEEISTEIRAGSQEPIVFELKADAVAINLTGVASVRLILKDLSNSTIIEYSTLDGSPILTIKSPATDGKVQLDPLTSTFVNGQSFMGYFVIKDASDKDIPVPENYELSIKIRDKFE